MPGGNANFTKSDIQDAYKLIFCTPNERKFFAFKWLGKYFLDISTPFGSKAAPVNFDNLAETIVNITKTLTRTPNCWIHRQLDDVPIVTQKNSEIVNKFVKKYKEVCTEYYT